MARPGRQSNAIVGAPRALIVALALVALCATTSHSQLPAPPATTEEALQQMLAQAGVVFTGQVIAVRHIASANGSTGTIEIDFAVEDAVLGVAPDSTYILREWAGLAPNGDSQYIIGRRYLIFLYAPGPSGLSSPVGGPDGAIPIVPGNPAAAPDSPDTEGLAAQAALRQAPPSTASSVSTSTRVPIHTTFRIGPATPETSAPTIAVAVMPQSASPLASATVDLRWIATRVLTPVSYADAEVPAAGKTFSLNASEESRAAMSEPFTAGVIVDRSVLRGSTNPASTTAPVSTTITASQPTTTSANYADLLANLHAWQKEARAAR